MKAVFNLLIVVTLVVSGSSQGGSLALWLVGALWGLCLLVFEVRALAKRSSR